MIFSLEYLVRRDVTSCPVSAHPDDFPAQARREVPALPRAEGFHEQQPAACLGVLAGTHEYRRQRAGIPDWTTACVLVIEAGHAGRLLVFRHVAARQHRFDGRTAPPRVLMLLLMP